MQDFDNGSIYWSAETGAHEVHGAIRDKWQEMGWERSKLRYPTGSEIQWTQTGGPVVRKSQRLDD